MFARYALYFAPDDQSALGQFGQAIFGRNAIDARSADASSSFIHRQRWQKLTRKPSHYGFHATLKAPFELKPDSEQHDLAAACKELAHSLTPVVLRNLAPRRIKEFAALTLAERCTALDQLERACVTALEPWRAPISEHDIQRRITHKLSERQIDQLKRFGYPYIFDDFQFHMTLSDRLADNDHDYVQWLERVYDHMVGSDPVLDRIALFAQRDRNSAFTRIEEFCFA